MSECNWISDGRQCRFPGIFAESTTGSDRWLCPYHHRAPDQADGREIVERSHRWAALPNRAEAYLEVRRRQVYGEGDPPEVARLRAQIAAHQAGRTVGILSSRLMREPGEDREAA